MGTESKSPEGAKGGNGAAYVMPDWVGRMASLQIYIKTKERHVN